MVKFAPPTGRVFKLNFTKGYSLLLQELKIMKTYRMEQDGNGDFVRGKFVDEKVVGRSALT